MNSISEPSKAFQVFTKYHYPYPSTKGFPTTPTRSGVLLKPSHLLTVRMRASLVHGANKSSDPHQHTGHLLQAHPSK
jgi:hypothetical protein